MSAVPAVRVRRLNEVDVVPRGDYVLYWMTAFRRTRFNFALQYAAELAARLDRPLLVLEPLRVDYEWASDRLHRFVIQGMADNFGAADAAGMAYYPYVEPQPNTGSGLLQTLARGACAVVTDDYPTFFLPRMLAAAAARLPVTLIAVDSNGILPLRAADRVFPTAFAFRRFLQKTLPEHLPVAPADDALAEAPRGDGNDPIARLHRLGLQDALERWPAAMTSSDPDAIDLSRLPIDHSVLPVDVCGGQEAAGRRLQAFLSEDLDTYVEGRNSPELDPTSKLSGWLHFGHLSSHEVLAGIAAHENWTPDAITDITSGKRTGWWNLSESAEAYLDQLVTWRELGFNMCWQRDDHDRYESLPDWAQGTLAEHAGDERPYLYSLAQFEAAETHDELWNAAQRQLVRQGRIHNYLRMLWGKKILHWSESPLQALEIMVQLNNKYGLDGRDPNSWSGIFWCLGRYDRAWGPERPVFGKIRYMTSANTARKHRVKGYLERFAPDSEPSSDD